MMRALNELLAKHVRGGATEEDFREFMDQFGHMFPPGIEKHRRPGGAPGAPGRADGVLAQEHA